MANQLTVRQANINQMKSIIASDKIKARMNNLLGKEAGTFLASALDLYTSDSKLSQCDATRVMAECMKAAALKLPVAKSLGFCYVIPYGNVPQFQLGYKGLLQLAQRSGQYKYLNADVVYEGEIVHYNRITGMLEIAGEATSDKPIGYFAYFQLLNGFEKCVYWSREKVEAHAKRFSKAWSKADSPWHTDFDAMAIKTVLKALISKYGVMSVEFASAISQDYEDTIEAEVAENANGAPVTLPKAPAAAIPADTQPTNTASMDASEIELEMPPEEPEPEPDAAADPDF